MKTVQEEREELDEQFALVRAEINSLEEEKLVLDGQSTAHFKTPTPARLRFVVLRIKYLAKTLKQLEEKDKAARSYEEWDRRTRP